MMAMPDFLHAYALQLQGAPPLSAGGEPVHLGRRKAMGLLAYLAFGKRAYNRDTLAAVFWPDYDQVHARGSLRRLLSELHRQLGKSSYRRRRNALDPWT
jgi:DNA-binding SARP family transcriptional activator